jgi:hypothetical protein
MIFTHVFSDRLTPNPAIDEYSDINALHLCREL